MPKQINSDLARSRLTTAIGIIFGFEERWLEFFYSHKNGEIRLSPEELIQESRCFSRGEQVMIKVALELWTDGGCATISEIINALDWENLCRVLLAVMVVRDITAEDLAYTGSRYES